MIFFHKTETQIMHYMKCPFCYAANLGLFWDGWVNKKFLYADTKLVYMRAKGIKQIFATE